MHIGHAGAPHLGALASRRLDETAGRGSFGVLEHAAAGGFGKRLAALAPGEVALHLVAHPIGIGGLGGQLAFQNHLVRRKGARAIAPRDLVAAAPDQTAARPVGGDGNDTLPYPLIRCAGVHAQGAAYGARGAHGELEAADGALEGLLHHRGERGASAHDEAIPVEAQGAEIASEGDGHAGEAPVGHEHVGAAAEHDPRRALGRAHIDQPRERPHGIRAHEKARRASDAVGGVAT